jgi:hypothetical protein
VNEGSHPKPFRCLADAFPPAKYYWQDNDGNSTTQGSVLDFRHPVKKEQVREEKRNGDKERERSK